MGSTKTSSRRRKTVKNRLRGKSRSNKKSLKKGGGHFGKKSARSGIRKFATSPGCFEKEYSPILNIILGIKIKMIITQ
jgi:hypothetical protein